jgi:hypothetical protein
MDCVLGYHLNPLTCGIAKFNLILARQLNIPVLGIFDTNALNYQRPLLSVKISEFRDEDIAALDRLLDAANRRQSLRLFLHAFSGTAVELKMIRQAEIVYCGNSELVAQLHDLRSDLVEVWCPGTLFDTQRFNHAEVSVFSFGMAHKVRSDYYRKLCALLERTGKSYCLYLSTALHDSTSFDESFAVAFEELREIFGGNVYFLGYLSDTAVYNYLSETTFFAAFFDKGVRANNTSVNAAMQCGSVVITNLDQYSPSSFIHLDNLLDIRQCSALPTDRHLLSRICAKARATATHTLGWDGLIAQLAQEEMTVRLREQTHQ